MADALKGRRTTGSLEYESMCDMAGVQGRDALGKGHSALQVFDAIPGSPLHAVFRKESISEGGLALRLFLGNKIISPWPFVNRT